MPSTMTIMPFAPSRRRFWLGALASLMALPLEACGPSESDQRAAFIAFLKARIVDKPGIHLPIPTDDERKSFGPYAAQFDVIANFNHALNEASNGMMGKSSVISQAHDIDGLVANKDKLAQLSQDIDKFAESTKAQLAAAGAARDALPPQPDDLKPVYAAAYDRDVTGPAAGWLEAAPLLRTVLASMLDLANFVDAHKGLVTTQDGTVQTKDPKLVEPLNALLKTVNDGASKLNDEMQKLQKLAYGL